MCFAQTLPLPSDFDSGNSLKVVCKLVLTHWHRWQQPEVTARPKSLNHLIINYMFVAFVAERTELGNVWIPGICRSTLGPAAIERCFRKHWSLVNFLGKSLEMRLFVKQICLLLDPDVYGSQILKTETCTERWKFLISQISESMLHSCEVFSCRIICLSLASVNLKSSNNIVPFCHTQHKATRHNTTRIQDDRCS